MPQACLLLFIAVLTCASQETRIDPDLALLGRIRQRMAENLDRLPNYTCQEIVERSVFGRLERKLLFSDRIRLEVAFIGLRERFAWPGSARFEHSSMDDMVAVGASGHGTFAGWTQGVFSSPAPVFEYGSESPVGGRRALQYNFRAPLSGSTYKVKVLGREAMVPYAGSAWIDPETLDVLRVEIRAEPSDLAVESVTTVIDYGRVRIGEEEFLLPQSAALSIVDLHGDEHRNLSRFTGCRQYRVNSSISFDVRNVEPAAPAPALREVRLPAGVALEVRLDTPIRSEASATGDPVSARLARPVQAGGVNVPKGAVLSGRIRRLEQYYAPEKLFIVGLEFTSLSWGDTRASLRARLSGPRLKVRERRESAFYGGAPQSRGIEASGLDIDDSDPNPPFGVFRMWSKDLRIQPGLRMIWETRE